MVPDRPPLELVTDVEPIPAPPRFLAQCDRFGIALEPEEIERLGRYLGLLLVNDERLNLTAIKDPEDGFCRHLFDALTLLSALDELPDGASVADVGSGGGLPALPLAVVKPALSFTLVEATAKKAHFLREAARTLGLERVTVVAERAETVGRDPSHRDRHAAVTARAVGPLRVLLELTLPLVAPGGFAVLVKGEKADAELAEAKEALRLLGGRYAGTLDTPTGKLVRVDKVGPTPRRYPRRPGEPKARPL